MLHVGLMYNVIASYERYSQELDDLFTEDVCSYILELYEEALNQGLAALVDLVMDVISQCVHQRIEQCLSKSLLHKLKLNFIFFVESQAIATKTYKLLRDINKLNVKSLHQLFVECYETGFFISLHQQHLGYQKLKRLSTELTLHCLKLRRKSLKESDQLLLDTCLSFLGSFSLSDLPKTSLANLQVIGFLAEFPKCLHTIKDHFLTTIRDIIYTWKSSDKVGLEALQCCLKILGRV